MQRMSKQQTHLFYLHLKTLRLHNSFSEIKTVIIQTKIQHTNAILGIT